jgi:hypothetical protein
MSESPDPVPPVLHHAAEATPAHPVPPMPPPHVFMSPAEPDPMPVVPATHPLSPAEVQAALDKAVADKRKELGLDPETVKARQEQEAARKIRAADVATAAAAEEAKREREARGQEPDRWVGLDGASTGTYAYVKVSVSARQHRLTVAGVTYEHVATDGEGIWLYRYMP